MFIVALPSIMRIPCNAVPPDRGCQVNLTLSFPIGRNGGGRAIMGMAKFAKNHQILSRIKA
jgi:hypothetical protein